NQSLKIWAAADAAPEVRADGVRLEGVGWTRSEDGFLGTFPRAGAAQALELAADGRSYRLQVVPRTPAAAVTAAKAAPEKGPAVFGQLHGALEGASPGEWAEIAWTCAAFGDPDLDFRRVEAGAADRAEWGWAGRAASVVAYAANAVDRDPATALAAIE